ncbi:grasp-with-spasm system ATP-grasp peptide maturase [Tenacibaculum sp. nBUS_03]|uniref:grasp-with-spasm system ATP-grasp peptide maturase n=1 Tax=Tenacibaculum sp. nBUS_03 TaxID=3395320 RepID=UPI003EBF2BFF
MVLINSTDEDYSTDEVIRWLYRFETEFIRLNGSVEITNIRYSNGTIKFNVDNDKEISLEEIKAYWYRRGNFQSGINVLSSNNKMFDSQLEDFLIKENNALLDFLLDHLKNEIPCIGDSKLCIDVNKNANLIAATKEGLLIPDFLLTSKKSEVLDFLNEQSRIITKSINVVFNYSNEDYWYPSYTNEVTLNDLEKFPDNFQVSLFQKRLDKKYDIRSFYLDEKIYSMAIFSQNDEQTETDFRKYIYDKPNRSVPFKLPNAIEEKVIRLMKKLKYESGSIDFVYTKDAKFYFLEINPIGQFGMTSYPCNYQLEKKIAEHLTTLSNGRK